MSLLNYELELRTILNAVSPAGQVRGADVRILNWGTVGAVRAALAARPAHILHISCHAEPGHLCLETGAGEEDLVDARRMISEMIPAGSMIPPLIVLARCSTSRDVRSGTGGPALPGLARGLNSAGAPAVIAMTGAVRDEYATEFAGKLYDRLASEPDTDVVTAFATVRRLFEEGNYRGSSQWHIPAIFARNPLSLVLSSPGSPPITGLAMPAREPEPDPADYASYFVGRRAELRDVLSSFQTGSAGILICGMGGIGKTSFNDAAIAMLGGAAGIPVRISADQPPEQIVAVIIHAVRRRGAFDGDALDQAAAAVVGGKLSWPSAFARVRDLVLANQPVLLVLDVSNDDLVAYGNSYTLAYPELGVFLAAWMACGDSATLLAASPHPFRLPGGPDSQPEARFLGALSEAETLKLALQLPAVRGKATHEQLRPLGGHPRALVRLNSRLIGDPQQELAAAVNAAISAEVEATGLTKLLAGLADDAAALRLVTGASVYRRPVSRVGMNWQLADSLDPATEPDRLDRLREVLGGPEPGEGLSPQLRDDLSHLRRPADDPRLADALLHAMALGVLSGPFNPREAAAARFMVPIFVVESILARADPAVIVEAHRRAAAYWRWSNEVASSDDSYDITDMWRIEEALDHLYWARDAAGTLDMASELITPALLRGTAGAQVARGLGALLAQAAPNPSRELCGAQLALGSAYWMLGDHDQSIRELSAGVSTAHAVGDDLLAVACATVLARQLAATGQAASLTTATAESAAEDAAERADDDVLRAAVLLTRALAAVVSGQFDLAITLAEQTLALLPSATDHPLARAGQQFELALVAEALSQSDAATATRRQASENSVRGLLAVDTEFTAHGLISTAAVTIGRIDDADYHAGRLVELADAFPYAGNLARAWQARGMVHLARNELDAAEEMFRATLRDPAVDHAGTRATCFRPARRRRR